MCGNADMRLRRYPVEWCCVNATGETKPLFETVRPPRYAKGIQILQKEKHSARKAGMDHAERRWLRLRRRSSSSSSMRLRCVISRAKQACGKNHLLPSGHSMDHHIFDRTILDVQASRTVM